MTETVSRLDEVVVIGYGTVKKRDLTGSVSSVSTRDIGNTSVANVGQMMQGEVSGVDISSSDGGLPGAGMNIKIRGTTSINSTSPLTIIDGMPGDIDMVAPSEIESIDILKDASTAAIYGSRGANGVIIITTKKGKPP
jgi:TonB-dependent starch-binding outer membrane protein SusC